MPYPAGNFKKKVIHPAEEKNVSPVSFIGEQLHTVRSVQITDDWDIPG